MTSRAAPIEPSLRPLLSSWARAILAPIAAFFGGWLGLHLGNAFGFALARLTDRDIAELKDVLIWFTVLGAAVCAVAGIWLTLWLTRSRAGRSGAPSLHWSPSHLAPPPLF